jgi:hypothetical protein
MLTKPVGSTGYYTLNTSTGTCNVSTLLTGDLYGTGPGQTLPARKVRIAVTQPAAINFGTKIANLNSDILMPANTVEHFTLQATNTVTFVLIAGASAGMISITPVA